MTDKTIHVFTNIMSSMPCTFQESNLLSNNQFELRFNDFNYFDSYRPTVGMHSRGI